MCGDIADFTSFSFHAVKNLTTAEGGALTWRPHDGLDGEVIYKQLQLLSLHGQSKDALAKTKLGAWEYDIVAPYYKCNMTDIMAGIGLAQLKRYPELMHRRRQIIGAYNAALGVAETSGKNEGGRSAKGTAGEGCTSGAAGKFATEAAADTAKLAACRSRSWTITALNIPPQATSIRSGWKDLTLKNATK